MTPVLREKRWMLLTTTGHHSWVGRATDPSSEEITAFEATFHARGISGWLAACDGDYWCGNDISLMEVKPLNVPKTPFSAARDAFLRLRDDVLRSAG